MAGIRKRNWNGVHRRAAGISLVCLLAAAVMVTGSCGKKPEPEPTSEPVPATTEGTTKDAILAPPVPTTPAETEPAKDPDEVPESLVKAAQLEGALTVWGSCEPEYLEAVCNDFSGRYGIDVKFRRKSSNDIYQDLLNSGGSPSADIWFGGRYDPVSEAAADGLLAAYEAENEGNLKSRRYRDEEHRWYAVSKDLIGFVVNTDAMKDPAPEGWVEAVDLPDTWEELADSRYYGRIAMPDPKITGAGRMIITSMVEKMGRDDALAYLRKLDGNVKTYAESTDKAAELAASGDCAVAVTFLHDGIAAMRKMNDQLDLVVPSDETGFDLETSAILKGCRHPAAAKLWTEYILTPGFGSLGAEHGSCRFPVTEGAALPEEAERMGLDMESTIDYDFEDAKDYASVYVEDFYAALVE